jgi:uncharacterized membrane protein
MEPRRAAAAEFDIDTIPGPDEMPSPARLEAFSDAVFAIIITLLVLDLRVPREDVLRGEPLIAVLLHQWPVYVAYVLSFLQVGVVWCNHHTMFHYIRRSDHFMLVCNLLLLLCVAVLPFTTALLSEYARANESDLQVAALIYSAVLGIAGIFFSAMWRHALHAGLLKPHADPHRLHTLELHWLLVPLFYGVAFGLAFVDPSLSVAMYVLLLLYYALPGPAVIRWMIARRARKARPPTCDLSRTPAEQSRTRH